MRLSGDRLSRDGLGVAEELVEGELVGQLGDLVVDLAEGGGIVALVEGAGDPGGDLRISPSFMPRVVSAGVPMRMPEGFMGGLVS